jgi:uncharacterized membrane protein YeaQ/YmgE (transglycosylase-associated protein family)
MDKRIEDSERAYRIIDGIYRIHRDLFEIENVLTKTTRLQLKLASISINGRMGVFVAGLLAIVPILTSLCDIKWGSVSAIIIYSIAGAVVLLWIYQVHTAGTVVNDLTTIEGSTSAQDIKDSDDFLLEEVNAYVVRHKILDSIIREFKEVTKAIENNAEKSELEERTIRYEEILKYCEDCIEDTINKSADLVKKQKRLSEAHELLLDWASAIKKFARKKEGNE